MPAGDVQPGHGDEPSAPTAEILLANAVDELYSAFSRYPLKARIEGCPCCVGDEDRARLHSQSLRALSADDLERYASKALTTWGDADDFRHFLPRLLELLTGHPHDMLATEIVLSKLGYAGWWEWPERERVAIESVLLLRWRIGLELDPEQFDADAWLCGLTLAGVEVSDYIDVWKSSGAPKAFAHTVAFIEANPDLVMHGTLRNAFYPGGEADRVTSGAMREWLSTCMADPQFQEQLAAWYQGPR
jgi:hypothetical protein